MIKRLFGKQNIDYPDFWKVYLAHFKNALPTNLEGLRFVVLDTETTGFDYKKDRILCIGAVAIQNNTIEVSNTFEVYIKQTHFNPETVAIHGILKDDKTERVTELEALKQFLVYLENAVIVAHHAVFDITMINKALKRHQLPLLQNKILDTSVLYRHSRIKSNLIDKSKHYTLDELAENLAIELYNRHTAVGDAYTTALIFMKLLNVLGKGKKLSPQELLKLSASV
ncbi:MAG TPA: 3'-5' exonuclease [Flavobacteriaceae bacterium]|nr:3'-5' exonuclease [Flavobacteriaceae bacterium]